MADNVAIKDFSGSSVTVLADQVTDGTLGTGEVQYVKIMDGVLDGTNKAAVSTNGLAVDLRAGGSTSTTGAITTSSTAIPLDVTIYSHAIIQLTGTYAGVNAAFEGSVDGGTTYFSILASRLDGTAAEATTGVLANTTRAWEFNVSSFTHLRIRSTAFTSGSGAVTIRASLMATEPNVNATILGTAAVSGTVAVSGNVGVVGQGGSGPLLTKLTDGTNIPNVKAASTAAIATDPALVVAISPNNTIPISGVGIPTALGSSTSANSMRVVIATDQVAVPIKGNLLDNAGFTDGTTPVDPVGFIFDEVAGTALTENDVAAPRIDAKRSVVSVIEDASTRGQRASVSAAGALKVDGSAVAQPASQSGTWTVQPGNTQNSTPWLVQQVTATSGGCSVFHLVTAASTNATNVKSSAGQLYGWYILNTNTVNIYLKFHNTATAPTAGASVFFVLGIPGGGAANVFGDTGIAFPTGIGITTVTGVADTDATAVALNDLNISLFYK